MPDLAFLERFDAEWKKGKSSREEAKALAIEYVEKYEHELAPALQDLGIPELVKLVDGYRAAGREHERIAVDCWLLAKFAPQHIVGTFALGSGSAIAQAVDDALRRGQKP